jgi:hypothetical protein
VLDDIDVTNYIFLYCVSIHMFLSL